MDKIYTRKCSCGNIITIEAEHISEKENKIRILGAKSGTGWLYYMATCPCGKIHNFSRVINKFSEQESKNE